MKKLIFKKFTKDLTYFFLLVSISITLIVWVIQAVNFLDIVTEDGHGFRIYFLYTLLTIPKIFSKILPFIYFISVFYIIQKYENNNELIIFWSIGIKKIDFINILTRFSIIYLIIQLFLTTYFVPKTLDQARSFIRSSNVDLFSSIVKEKKFIDTVKDLTIFVEERKGENLKNIFLKENLGGEKNQIIISKNGKIVDKNKQSVLVLFDGKVINNDKEKTNSFDFSESEINLSKFSTKTTTHPKLQEISTNNIILCISLLKNSLIKKNKILKNTSRGRWDDLRKNAKKTNLTNCTMKNLDLSYQEIFKRFVLPFYVPVLSLIACLIIIKSKDDFKFSKYKILLFIFGVITIIVSELSTKYFGSNFSKNAALISFPIALFTFVYFYLIKKFSIPLMSKK